MTYEGEDVWVNKRTGEEITADSVSKRVGRSGFMITYMAYMLDVFELLGTKKMQVMKYILKNMDKKSNMLIITTEQLSKSTKTSRPVVSETLKILEENGLVVRKIGIIMLNPKIAHKGTEGKERYLLTKFTSFNDEIEE